MMSVVVYAELLPPPVGLSEQLLSSWVPPVSNAICGE